jgi:hypothetical protein
MMMTPTPAAIDQALATLRRRAAEGRLDGRERTLLLGLVRQRARGPLADAAASVALLLADAPERPAGTEHAVVFARPTGSGPCQCPPPHPRLPDLAAWAYERAVGIYGADVVRAALRGTA